MADSIPVSTPDSPPVRHVGIDRPWTWLAAGWQDLAAFPAVSLCYGLVFALCGLLLLFLMSQANMWYIVLPLAAGFMLGRLMRKWS